MSEPINTERVPLFFREGNMATRLHHLARAVVSMTYDANPGTFGEEWRESARLAQHDLDLAAVTPAPMIERVNVYRDHDGRPALVECRDAAGNHIANLPLVGIETRVTKIGTDDEARLLLHSERVCFVERA